MSRLKWSFALIVAASAALVLIVFKAPSHNRLDRTISVQPVRPQAQAAALAPASADVVTSHQPTDTRASSSYKTAFQSSKNYAEFARKLLPAASAGDPNAQYRLWQVLERCDEDNKLYFLRGGQRLSLDEGLQFAVKRHLPIEVAQLVFDRCHEFPLQDVADFGSAAEWLAKATDAGQPIAQAATAEKLLLQVQQDNFTKAGAAPLPSDGVKIDNQVSPRALLSAALRSRDPEALFLIGDAQGLLHPSDNDTNTTRFSYWLVACQRGLDCSASADWVRNVCAGNPQCASAGDPNDLVRIFAGDKWPDVQQRALEINARLDAGEWNALDPDL